jgi:hypothetical protein
MANVVTLQCWLHGDDPKRVFPVKIDQTDVVGALKDAIKEKKRPEFDHIAADKLDLWTVAIPLDDSLNKKLKNLELDEGGALPGGEELSELFPGEPAKKCLHIIVKSPAGKLAAFCVFVASFILKSLGFATPPIVELNCLVLGDDPCHIFPIKINTTESVGTLKEAIKDKKRHAFQHVDADTLVLWKVSVPNVQTPTGNPANFDLPDERSLLSATDRLSKVFSGGPKEGHIHIVVNSPMSGECMSCSPLL